MNVTLAATYLELSEVDSAGDTTYADLILTSHIKDIKADGVTLFLNCRDFQSRHYDRQITYSDIVKYTYLGTETPLPAFWTLYANIRTQVVTQAIHP